MIYVWLLSLVLMYLCAWLENSDYFLTHILFSTGVLEGAVFHLIMLIGSAVMLIALILLFLFLLLSVMVLLFALYGIVRILQLCLFPAKLLIGDFVLYARVKTFADLLASILFEKEEMMDISDEPQPQSNHFGMGILWGLLLGTYVFGSEDNGDE